MLCEDHFEIVAFIGLAICFHCKEETWSGGLCDNCSEKLGLCMVCREPVNSKEEKIINQDKVQEKFKDPDSYWYSYECYDSECPSSFQNKGSGVIMDIRLSRPSEKTLDHPEIKCPLCQVPMIFKDCWNACRNGYGSTAAPCSGDDEGHH